MREIALTLTVNGERLSRTVEARRTLADFLRDDLSLTGTHLGCEHGICGACTVLLDGDAVRSCLMFAVQADGAEVTTIEGLSGRGGGLTPIQAPSRPNTDSNAAIAHQVSWFQHTPSLPSTRTHRMRRSAPHCRETCAGARDIKGSSPR